MSFNNEFIKKMKICKTCLKDKNNDEYSQYNNRGKILLRTNCKSCINKKAFEHRKKDSYKLVKRKRELKKNYNMTIEQYNELFIKQNGQCMGCNKHQSVLKQTLSVDHNHNTGQIRGLLCYNCNLAIGHALENIRTLENLITYLSDSSQESAKIINLLKK